MESMEKKSVRTAGDGHREESGKWPAGKDRKEPKGQGIEGGVGKPLAKGTAEDGWDRTGECG